MTNKSSIPESWGIPDNQVNKMIEALSKKFIKPEDAVQNAFEEIVEISRLSNPNRLIGGGECCTCWKN